MNAGLERMLFLAATSRYNMARRNAITCNRGGKRAVDSGLSNQHYSPRPWRGGESLRAAFAARLGKRKAHITTLGYCRRRVCLVGLPLRSQHGKRGENPRPSVVDRLDSLFVFGRPVGDT